MVIAVRPSIITLEIFISENVQLETIADGTRFDPQFFFPAKMFQPCLILESHFEIIPAVVVSHVVVFISPGKI